QYDMQALINDVVKQLEAREEKEITEENYLKQEKNEVKVTQKVEEEEFEEVDWGDRPRQQRIETVYSKNNFTSIKSSRKPSRGTFHSFNFDLGTNNYIGEDGKFPDATGELYTVRPLSSWYVALNSMQKTRINMNSYLDWGLGVSWYNFKFQDNNILMTRGTDQIDFAIDDRDVNHIKSKLTASYVNATIVPMLDFGKGRRWNYGRTGTFRMGLGGYVGYRIGSHTKLVYNDGGREKEKENNSFYLNNLRYGARAQVGFRGTDFFFNYDLNELFVENRGPKLNAFSFGITF
ncbi:MAG TPA: hypothetical protein PKC24_08285, partial [Cyclobacteriaceae bacterium]|nr:hypothetical protein [Cyclobacteriaceae bacterium]